MKMRRIVLLLLFTCIVAQNAFSEDSVSLKNNCAGIWSASAQAVSSGDGALFNKISSPDGRYNITGPIEGLDDLGVKLEGKNRSSAELDEIVGVPWLTEVLWLPDSRSFIVNSSEGGLVGTWEMFFYTIDDDGNPAYHDMQSRIAESARKSLRCNPFDKEDENDVLNFGVAGLLNEGKEALVVAEVPNHSVCKNMGKTIGLRVSLKDFNILEQYSEEKLFRKWSGFFGCFLREKVKS